MTPETNTPIDPDRLNALLGQAVVEFGATVNAALVVIGDRLGLYRALAGAGPLTPTELAGRTGTAERYVREWLGAQAASGYVQYDADSGRYGLTAEQAAAFADESSPAFVGGGFQVALGAAADIERIQEAFLTGRGMGWHEHGNDVFEGCRRFFEPGYRANLLASWIPALDGVDARLQSGGRVADVGCGHGASTMIIAQGFPNAEVVGFDYHEASIAEARRLAEEAGVADRLRFEVATADAFPGSDYDLVTSFDCLHDMGDPVAVSRHVHGALADAGAWMIVEPKAGDHVEDNLNPVGRAYYAFSTMLCTPSSLSQEGGLSLGAQAGEGRLRVVVTSGGFTRFRRAAETPFNLVLEARR
ncbi:MAG: class I SAM-dependent methyltransferase [Solirubrobacterales bacterium]|nr:class I SAM-dependent methyltransferase [Solirubrobacterales bacterium]